jgi:ATP phosphoribosyltransferase
VRPIRIALTKGRIEEEAVGLMQKAGYDCAALMDKGRRLVAPIDNGRIEAVFAKAADVITYTESGVCDIGIVGKDTIMEMGGSFYEMCDLGFGLCRFALAAPKGLNFYAGYSARRIATKYPRVTAEFFGRKQMDVKIIKIEGSVELSPLLGLSDAIVDLVQTGMTLKENGLEVIEEIAPVSARLIVNIASLKLRKEEIEQIVGRIENAKGGASGW